MRKASAVWALLQQSAEQDEDEDAITVLVLQAPEDPSSPRRQKAARANG